MMQIKTLKDTSTKELFQVFNLSFSDYFVPLKLTEEQLKTKLIADKIDLNLSVGVFKEGQLIAFILHGVDIINQEKWAYNGGTGVIPKQRGQGLTKQMYQFILPKLKEKGINHLVLEVISENTPAITSYQKSGFKIQRTLNCFKGELKDLKVNPNIEIHSLKTIHWPELQTFWDIHPTWQNSIQTLTTIKNQTSIYGAFRNTQLIGYVVFNPSSKRIQQIAISKIYRKQGIASTLLSKLKEEYSSELSVINVDKKNAGINLFFNKIGLKIVLEQKEMTWGSASLTQR